MPTHFDLVDLRLMVHIAEADSLTKGAKASHISLPAASTRVKNLEDSVGAKLLYRTSLGVTLTPPGQALVYHARLMLGQLEHLQDDMQEYAKGIKGHLRMFSNTTAMGEFLPPVLNTYMHRHPEVNIDLREKASDETVRAISEGHIDIGIIAGIVRTENLEVMPYRQNRLVLVVPNGHPLASAESVDFKQTLDFNHVGMSESSPFNYYFRQACNGLDRYAKFHIRVGNFETACRMVEAGMGISIMSIPTARRHAQSMAITIVDLNDELFALHSHLICVRSFAALPGFARDLVDMLVADAQAHGTQAL